ncbi:MAG: hypothetical protein A3K65_09755 [Euryarchaeota archaeon RBG_16_68_12]|nr:MAG: hypothetical protein A3K65_09755 [Euryarchaeota archaeon RBG_16_68_12]
MLMELGMGEGAATIVAAEDGTASLYITGGSGIIGMGFHSSTAAAALAFVGCARSFVGEFPVSAQFPLPRGARVAFRIVTRTGVHSAEFAEEEFRSDSPITPIYQAGQHLMTRMRLLDEQRLRVGLSPQALHVHVYDDGGLCLLAPGDPEPTWLALNQLQRVLEIAKGHGDRLTISQERGDGRLSPIVRQVVEASALPLATARPPRQVAYFGGTTTLHYAVDIARVDIVEDLARRGANLEARDQRGYSPLILAAFKGRTPALRILLEAGASVKAHDRHGNGVLLFAAQWGGLEAVKLLLGAGADMTVRGQNGYTALTVAKLCKQAEVAQFLGSRGAPE